jgi:hypothetical protein
MDEKETNIHIAGPVIHFAGGTKGRAISFLILILGLCVFATCKRDKENVEDLTIPLRSYNGNELKTNGYYYRISQDNMGNTAYEIYFLSLLSDKTETNMDAAFMHSCSALILEKPNILIKLH